MRKVWWVLKPVLTWNTFLFQKSKYTVMVGVQNTLVAVTTTLPLSNVANSCLFDC